MSLTKVTSNINTYEVTFMKANEFNQACRYLRPEQMVCVLLVTGQQLTGFPLRHIKAGNYDGSLELETKNGIIQILSSSLESIELANGQNGNLLG
jgi:hypothetical protein